MEFRGINPNIISTSVSHVVKVPFDPLLSWAGVHERVYDSKVKGRSSYDVSGNELDDEPRLGMDDFDFDDSDISAGLEALVGVMDWEFELTPTGDGSKRSEIEVGTSLNAHFITGLNVNAPHWLPGVRILVLCAGDCQDILRIPQKVLLECTHVDLIGVTDVKPGVLAIFREMGAKVRTSSEYHHVLPLDWYKKYDYILCHQNLNHVMATKIHRERLRWLVDQLPPQGLLIGDRFDVVGACTRTSFDHIPRVGVEVLGVRPPDAGSDEGYIDVRVNGANWCDEIITDQTVYNSFPSSRYDVLVLSGRGAWDRKTLKGYPMIPPKSVNHLKRRSEVKCMSYIEIRKSPKGFTRVDYAPGPWVKDDKVPAVVLDQLRKPLNRGVPILPEDMVYIHSGKTLYSEKSDGYCGTVALWQGKAYRKLVHQNDVWSCPTDVAPDVPTVAQIEYVNGKTIVVEPLTPPNTAFLPRLSMWKVMESKSEALKYVCPLKQWWSSWEACVDVIPPDSEGVVCMSVDTPPPDGNPYYSRTALYVKKVATVDVKMPGGNVVEWVWDQKLKQWKEGRVRDDKTRGNTVEEEQRLRYAILYDEMEWIMRPPSDDLAYSALKLYMGGMSVKTIWKENPRGAFECMKGWVDDFPQHMRRDLVRFRRNLVPPSVPTPRWNKAPGGACTHVADPMQSVDSLEGLEQYGIHL